MNKDTLYEVETHLYKEVDLLKEQHARYISGIKKGIDMTVDALRKKMNEENQRERLYYGVCYHCKQPFKLSSPEVDTQVCPRCESEWTKHNANAGKTVFLTCEKCNTTFETEVPLYNPECPNCEKKREQKKLKDVG